MKRTDQETELKILYVFYKFHINNILQQEFLEKPFPAFLSYDTDRIENDVSSSSSIVAAVTFTPNRCLAMRMGYTYRHTDRWEGFMKYAVGIGSGAMIYIYIYIYTKFDKDWFRHSKFHGGGGGNTYKHIKHG
jgi:hypothetical protein